MNDIIKQDFNQVYSIIDLHRKRAFQEINNNSLMTAWNVGGFVSDKEVNDVVEFVKKQGTPAYDSMIEEKIKSLEKKTDNGSGVSAGDAADDGNDPMLTDVGFYVIDSNKASIGNIQRKFKMGFNRAARIMDNLAEIGVVGPEEGTKPRQILMSREQFENYLEEYGG